MAASASDDPTTVHPLSRAADQMVATSHAGPQVFGDPAAVPEGSPPAAGQSGRITSRSPRPNEPSLDRQNSDTMATMVQPTCSCPPPARLQIAAANSSRPRRDRNPAGGPPAPVQDDTRSDAIARSRARSRWSGNASTSESVFKESPADGEGVLCGMATTLLECTSDRPMPGIPGETVPKAAR